MRTFVFEREEWWNVWIRAYRVEGWPCAYRGVGGGWGSRGGPHNEPCPITASNGAVSAALICTHAPSATHCMSNATSPCTA